ncbi:MAG: ADP-forming succinate--CoA ligase subunit beta [Acidimicrobiia bacterium]
MDLFEYQGKQLLASFGVPTSAGEIADSVEEAVAASGRQGWPVVLKAQVQVGGRGKAGGIRLAANQTEAAAAAEAILGLDMKGHVVRRLLVERATDIADEYYASFTLDRAGRGYLGMVSRRGGVDIEQVAAEDPGAVARVSVDPVLGFGDFLARRLVFEAALPEAARSGVLKVLAQLFRAFVESDAELIEVNPLVLTTDGRIHALDAKVSLDDNAVFRHPEWGDLGTARAGDDRERAARERGLNYIGLDGEVGIIGNGAGLVMSTLDVVSQAGGSAANFLDVGGGASAATISAALEVVTGDPKVRSVLVNIFGGITRCDLVAQGLLDAVDKTDLNVPVVVRLDGTSAAEGRALLAERAPAGIVSAPTMLEAAALAVELAGGSPGASGRG